MSGKELKIYYSCSYFYIYEGDSNGKELYKTTSEKDVYKKKKELDELNKSKILEMSNTSRKDI